MEPGNWIAVIAITISVVGAAAGWMFRMARGMTKLEALVHRVEKCEKAVEKSSAKLEDHAVRLVKLETTSV
tara:strand:+ start:11630 stop:11842 length:213 start_codon:yes stop_codon:yes gene_type:complete